MVSISPCHGEDESSILFGSAIEIMSKLQYLKQWKSAGRRFPCCKHDDDKHTYRQRNVKIRHQVKVKLKKYATVAE